MKKLIPLIVYPLAAIPAGLATGATVGIIQRISGSHSIWRFGDIDFALALLFWGALVFGSVSWLLFSNEKSFRIRDHLRHSFFLYIGIIYVLPSLITGYPEESRGLAYAGCALTAVICLAGILVNAAVLLILRRNLGRAFS